MKNLYYPEEEAFLCDYFKNERPEHLRSVDVHQPGKGIFVEKATDDDELNLANAVARLGLQQIQYKLPQWAAARGEELILGRKIRKQKKRSVEWLPLHLLTINWADGMPGYSWPEAYYLISFPLFNRYVVTASQDSPDAYGVEDMAIGWLPDKLERRKAAKKIIIGFWAGCENHRWAYLFEEGMISDEEANAWADKVWPEKGSKYGFYKRNGGH